MYNYYLYKVYDCTDPWMCCGWDAQEIQWPIIHPPCATKWIYLHKILQNVISLAQQGLSMQGNLVNDEVFSGCEQDSNYHQLCFYKLTISATNNDYAVLDIMKRKINKYTIHWPPHSKWDLKKKAPTSNCQ